ncbi:MAG: aminotransferase class I/II-fold pyridoxal phosphate-dependent enzyme [Clostridiales bacterium]|nr:aminotransferase class I/II-fold pyridoxal phosphate-dependent enzyme [Clostridiales bacterium]MCD8155244.1 aminotransferase class I/II-fold pyridoxal phosphate-dependent enzyme [Clostridiales bacterium]
MRELLSKRVLDMKPSGIRRFFDVANEVPGVVSLGVGEPDFDTPYHVREAGMEALRGGKTFYTSNSGLMPLREAISDYAREKTGNTYDPASEVMITVGGSEAIDVAMRTILNPGDEVICVEPCFVSYAPCIVLADGVPVPIRLRAEDNFRLKKEQLEAAVTEKTKALFLSFPNNPTGAIMEKEDLEALLPIIEEHNLLVISDEIYSELTYGKEHVSIASLPGMRDRTIVINGFSKSYAMTGWRLGYALGNHEIIGQMVKVHQYAIMCAPTVSQYAAVEAIRNGGEDVREMRESYNQRRRYVYHELNRMGLPCFEPEGAFYIFPDIRSLGMGSEEFALDLLEKEKVAVVPGNAFGESGEGFIRISYAYSIAELKEALGRMERYLNEKRKGDRG